MNEEGLLQWWREVLVSLAKDEILTQLEADTAELRLSDDSALRKTPRNYAATTVGFAGNPWGPVEVHRDLLSRSSRKVIAVCLHELGHVLDGTGRFDTLEDEDGEQRADRLVLEVLGVELRYDPKDLVQTLGAGIRRPEELR